MALISAVETPACEVCKREEGFLGFYGVKHRGHVKYHYHCQNRFCEKLVEKRWAGKKEFYGMTVLDED